MLLNDSVLKKLKCEQGKKYQCFSDDFVKSLYVFVYPSGKKYFKMRLKNGNYFKIAEYPLLSLAEIRALALEFLSNKAKGLNENVAFKTKFGALFDEVLKMSVKNEMAPKSIKRGLSYKESIFKAFENKDIRELKRADIIEALRQIEDKSATLTKAKMWVNKVFSLALQLDIIEFNPVAMIDNKIAFKRAKPEIHRATLLEPSQIKEYIHALKNASIKKTHKNLLLFNLLTAVRPANAICARWDEIDFEREVWSIAASKMKMRKDFVVPLSVVVLEILKEQEKERVNDYIFAGSAKNGHNSLNITSLINKRLGYQGKQSAHGFRAMFRTLANEHQKEHGLSMDIAEQCLAHEQKSKILKAYNRSENLAQRKELLNWWAQFLKSRCGL